MLAHDTTGRKAGQILAPLRAEIDALDRELIALLGRRFDLVRRVAQTKRDHALDVVQTERMREVLEITRTLAVKHDLDPDFIEAFYTLMIDHAHDVESGYQD